MAKKETKARPADQKSIKSFFTNGSKEEPVSDAEEVDESEGSSPPPQRAKGTKAPNGDAPKKSSLAHDLPPISQIPRIFEDIVSRTPKIQEVAERVQGRKLRIATMCSGTESPLLALEMIQHSIKDLYGVELGIEHVFSCEIEPFKQAYIERNFHPPILFRDVCELGNVKAHTAYGSLVRVPGNVDMLVAGTSCVDYSNLNNEKQDIDANGESGRTFRGMMSWVTSHRPPIVILENVCNAPWPRVKEKFEKEGYSAEFARVDTKNFYIPHTRTRVYLFAIDKKHSKLPGKWREMMLKELVRPASVTLEDFLLPSDDPRIHHARQKMIKESGVSDRRSGRTDWARCESRHQRARLEEGLGVKRPMTGWDENSNPTMPDFAWNDWCRSQVQRVWDLMEICYIRDAKDGRDSCFKSQVWNLSQNCDRSVGSGKLGISPCLTPTMIGYISIRGGPIVGVEALSLQGLPVDKLLLTRETEDQLSDLAGNAMSTTVVGSCMLAALMVAKDLLKTGDDTETYEEKTGNTIDEDEDDKNAMAVDGPTLYATSPEAVVVGEDQLVYHDLNLSTTPTGSFPELLARAARSSRLCRCEGRADVTSRELVQCADCAHTSCTKCGGRPEHNPIPIDVATEPRLSPVDFAKELKSNLPMCLSLSPISGNLLNDLKSSSSVEVPEKSWEKWCNAVSAASHSILRFAEAKRQEVWSVIYRSPRAALELHLHPQEPEWRIYALPEEHEPANAEVRQLLSYPFARLRCQGSLLEGQWEFALPSIESISITIKGNGALVPSWEQRLGITIEGLRDKQVHSSLTVSVAEDDVHKLDRDVSGTYVLYEKCGTATSALHKRQESRADAPPIFLMFDPQRTSDIHDSFIFTSSPRRYEYREARPLFAKISPDWRQSDILDEEEVQCNIPFRWVASLDTTLKATANQSARFGVADRNLDVGSSSESCCNSNAILSCTVQLGENAGAAWSHPDWWEVDKINERSTFNDLTWLLQHIQHSDNDFLQWQSVKLADSVQCERCAPTPPTIQWVKMAKKTVAIEDSSAAGEYERRLKRRPTPFVTQLKSSEDNTGRVRIGVNIPSLLHRALSRLPSRGNDQERTLSWRLDTNFVPAATVNLPKFVLSSNKLDKEHAQPPNFKLKLRKEQLRSLEWMIKQERKDNNPFVEEEISEAVLDPLGWRAEGRAEQPIHIRGGVLADQVGYGKTAITLGLIDCTAKSVEKDFAEIGTIEGKIPLKATLIVVPPHLTRQWGSEVKKFMKNKPEVLILSSVSNLNSATIEDFQNADMVVVASNLFKSNVYLENLQTLAGQSELPNKDGRHFNSQLERCLQGLKTQTTLLQEDGSQAVLKEVYDGQRRMEEEAAAMRTQTKRLKGKSYRDAVTKSENKSTATKPPAPTKASPESSAPSSPELRPIPKVNGTSALPTSKGMVPEVVIMVSRTSSVASASLPPSSEAEEEDEDEDKPSTSARPKRSGGRKSIIISDDEMSDEDVKPATKKGKSKANGKSKINSKSAKKGKSNGKAVKKSKGKSKSDDDDDEYSAEDQSSDEDFDEDSVEDNEDEDASMSDRSSDDEIAIKKSKTKAKPKPPPKSKAPAKSQSGTDSDAMDVDEPPKKSTKRKATDDEEEDDDKPAKKQKRVNTDPWKLGSKAVQKDWTEMHAPPLEMFHFARKVVDEYTYLDGKVHAVVTRLTADRHWVLSGTPPIHDFGAVKTISAFLNIHLGVDDDGEGQSAEVKKRKREQTDVEKFHSFREVHTLEWHAHRHQLGQTFLDRFVRQNIAEIDEIPWTEKVVSITLPAAERAIYLELEHHLRALEMTIKRGKKTESDREKRLAKSLGDSKSAEEALLKRCSHFDLETSNENAMKACDVIVTEREKQLSECKAELFAGIKDGSKREDSLRKYDIGTQSLFQEWVLQCRAGEIDDQDAADMIVKLINDAKVDNFKKKAKKEDVNLPEKVKALVWDHREKTHELRRLTKELVGRVRSLRYFTVVRDLQKQQDEPPIVDCPSCDKKNLPINQAAVLSSCGHTGCLDCVTACADNEECVYAASGACKSAARRLNIVRADSLGVDDKERDGKGKHFGTKLEKVVTLINKEIPKDERVLIFVQFPDLMKKVTEALSHNKIKFLEIRGTAHQKSKNLEAFQNSSSERVLLLNVMDESASGANLTSANHAIFLSPLLAPSAEIYKANETQAVGRLVRFGQTKHVMIWRMRTEDTIDATIFDQRKQDLSMAT